MNIQFNFFVQRNMNVYISRTVLIICGCTKFFFSFWIYYNKTAPHTNEQNIPTQSQETFKSVASGASSMWLQLSRTHLCLLGQGAPGGCLALLMLLSVTQKRRQSRAMPCVRTPEGEVLITQRRISSVSKRSYWNCPWQSWLRILGHWPN